MVELGVDDADANDLYAALDWLQQRQGRGALEKKLATRISKADGAVVLFDVSSSSYHGRTCPGRLDVATTARRGQVTEHCLRRSAY